MKRNINCVKFNLIFFVIHTQFASMFNSFLIIFLSFNITLHFTYSLANCIVHSCLKLQNAKRPVVRSNPKINFRFLGEVAWWISIGTIHFWGQYEILHHQSQSSPYSEYPTSCYGPLWKSYGSRKMAQLSEFSSGPWQKIRKNLENATKPAAD
jgi:hypothetical protein